MFEEKIQVKYSEIDYKQAVKPSAILNFFQDMASENAENLGFGYSFITKKSLAWFLLKYRIEFVKYPVGVCNLTLKTQPRGYNKIFAFRNFEICDGQELLARASSCWALVNTVSGKMANIGEALEYNSGMPLYEKQSVDLDFEKISVPSRIDVESVFDIRYDDIDVNCHANNCNYIIWALEPLGFDFRSSHYIKTMDIVFKKEIKFGGKVLSQIEIIDENHSLHVLKNFDTGEELCLINIVWS